MELGPNPPTPPPVAVPLWRKWWRRDRLYSLLVIFPLFYWLWSVQTVCTICEVIRLLFVLAVLDRRIFAMEYFGVQRGLSGRASRWHLASGYLHEEQVCAKGTCIWRDHVHEEPACQSFRPLVGAWVLSLAPHSAESPMSGSANFEAKLIGTSVSNYQWASK